MTRFEDANGVMYSVYESANTWIVYRYVPSGENPDLLRRDTCNIPAPEADSHEDALAKAKLLWD